MADIKPYKSGTIKKYKDTNEELEQIIIERETDDLTDFDEINSLLLEEIYRNSLIYHISRNIEGLLTGDISDKDILRRTRESVLERKRSLYIDKKKLEPLEKEFKKKLSKIVKSLKTKEVEVIVYEDEPIMVPILGFNCELEFAQENEKVSEVRCIPAEKCELDINCLIGVFGVEDNNFPVELEHSGVVYVVDYDGTITLYTQFSENLANKDKGRFADRVIAFANKAYGCLNFK